MRRVVLVCTVAAEGRHSPAVGRALLRLSDDTGNVSLTRHAKGEIAMSDRFDADSTLGEVSSGADGTRSTISFPYMSLDKALQVVQVIHTDYGTQCDHAQLAGGLNTTVTSSKFRMLVAAAKVFNLIEKHAKVATLTEVGMAAVDPTRSDEALGDAFLAVPLYRAIYDKFAGQVLPRDAGLEAEIRALGVTEKSASKARQTLQRSADYAGFFRQGKERLVRPANGRGDIPTQQPIESDDSTDASLGRPSALEIPGPSDELLRALWSKLPADRSEFPNPDRVQWLSMVELALNMVYGSAAEAPTADRST